MCGSDQSAEEQVQEQQRGPNARRSESGDVMVLSEEWGSFLHSFSRQHEGWLVSIFVFSGIETSLKVTHARLQRVTTDESQASRQICIAVVRDDGSHLVHQVANPVRLTFKRNPAGAHEGLDISSVDGSLTILRFRVATHPETLDGFLPDMRNGQAKRS